MSTPFIDEVYERVDFKRDLVFKFFTVFSLFEYALKRAGFARIGRFNNVEPNWSDFVNLIENRFTPNFPKKLEDAVTYMLNDPVRTQVLKNGSLDFESPVRRQNQSDIEWLSFLIRGVRNNLFHGAKFRYQPERDNELLQSSLIILEAWVECNDRVKEELQNVR